MKVFTLTLCKSGEACGLPGARESEERAEGTSMVTLTSSAACPSSPNSKPDAVQATCVNLPPWLAVVLSTETAANLPNSPSSTQPLVHAGTSVAKKGVKGSSGASEEDAASEGGVSKEGSENNGMGSVDWFVGLAATKTAPQEEAREPSKQAGEASNRYTKSPEVEGDEDKGGKKSVAKTGKGKSS